MATSSLPNGSNVMTLLQLAGGSVGDLGTDCVGDDDFGSEMIALAQACAASTSVQVNAQYLQLLGEKARAKWQIMHAFYAAYTVAITTERQMRPNAAVTLYGPDGDCGATYECGDEIPLTPRDGNTIKTAFSFNDEQMFYELFTGEADVAVGWRFQKGTVKFQGDVVSGMLGDVDFGVFGERSAAVRSPLQTYMYRRPDSTVTFEASAFHTQTGPQQLLNGATLLLLDLSCRNAVKGFGDSLFQLDFAEAVGGIMRQNRRICMRGGGVLGAGGGRTLLLGGT